MAKYQILYWQDIPSLVEARDGDSVHKEQLSSRFQELIDLVAMKKKLAGTDAYLEQWNKGKRIDRDGSARDVAAAIAGELEADFDKIREESLAKCRST
ncbi:MAG: virulence factor [Gammaproteobacteria bacterium]